MKDHIEDMKLQEIYKPLETENSSYKIQTEINLDSIVYSYIAFSPSVLKILNYYFKIVEIDDLTILHGEACTQK